MSQLAFFLKNASFPPGLKYFSTSKPHWRSTFTFLPYPSQFLRGGRHGLNLLQRGQLSTSRARMVEIGGVKATRDESPSNTSLIPHGYLPRNTDGSLDLAALDQGTLGHLRWMMQKDALNQDIFLLGSPGPERRRLVMQFCELMNKEVEYVAISKDTTESDLLLRRELRGGSSAFHAQAPVRAALCGRVLVLDGIEKAERNVLPTLNNLLENRELGLDDGRYLVPAEKYTALLAEEKNDATNITDGTGESESSAVRRWLRAVAPGFRAVALGLPAPPHPGHPLDPPLRSRFQARVIGPMQAPDFISYLDREVPGLSSSNLQHLVAFSETMLAIEHQQLQLGRGAPTFSQASLLHAAKVLAQFPDSNIGSVLARVYPPLGGVPLGFTDDQLEVIQKTVEHLGIPGLHLSDKCYTKVGYTIKELSADGTVVFEVSNDHHQRKEQGGGRRTPPPAVAARLPAGPGAPPDAGPLPGAVETAALRGLLAAMLQDHIVGKDICLLGGKGSGKSLVAKIFSKRTGIPIETFPLFKEMAARDLFQKRSTDEQGDTVWMDSPLVRAAKDGHIVVLDGVDRVSSDILTTLQRLAQDRTTELPDGSFLVRGERAAEADLLSSLAHHGERRAFPVHPAFRILALGDDGGAAAGGQSIVKGASGLALWLAPEAAGLFALHRLPRPGPSVAMAAAQARHPGAPPGALADLQRFSEYLERVQQGSTEQVPPLSLRQVLRIAGALEAAMAAGGGGSCSPSPLSSCGDSHLLLLAHLLRETLLLRYMPEGPREIVEKALKHIGVDQEEDYDQMSATLNDDPEILVTEETLRIGDVTSPRRKALRPELVPRPAFHGNPAHARHLRALLADHAAGRRALLVVGNQGVGKNKLVDRLLELLGAEREYVQLHRDTTVGSLTAAPALEAGRVVYADAPLVRAARRGRVLLVDEADKAPLEVVVLLKGLAEDGEMLLADGRRVLDEARVREEGLENDPSVVPIHPDFRLWVLANRPGFPFMGNDFFRECGDAFCVHAVDNPDPSSEARLLAQWAPGLPTALLGRLAGAFAELRALHHRGVLAYPYSVREAVAVVRHMDKYPDEGVIPALKNALSFDSFDQALWEMLAQVFNRHGVPLGADPSDDGGGGGAPRVALAEARPLAPPAPAAAAAWAAQGGWTAVAVTSAPLELEPSPATATVTQYAVTPARGRLFSEETGSLWLEEARSGYPRAAALTSLRHRRGGGWGGEGGPARTTLPPRPAAAAAVSVHALATAPLELHSFLGASAAAGGGGGRRVRTEVLGREWEYYNVDKKPIAVGIDAIESVAVLLPQANVLAIIDPSGEGGNYWTSLFPKGRSQRAWWGVGRAPSASEDGVAVLPALAARTGLLACARKGGNQLVVIDLVRGLRRVAQLPEEWVGAGSGVLELQALDDTNWLVTTLSGDSYCLNWSGDHTQLKLSAFKNISLQSEQQWNSKIAIESSQKSVESGESISEDILMSGNDSYLQILQSSFSQALNGTKSWKVEKFLRESDDPYSVSRMPSCVSRTVNGERIMVTIAEDQKNGNHCLEVVDVDGKAIRQISVKHTHHATSTSVFNGICDLGSGQVATLQKNGHLQFWEMDAVESNKSIEVWKKMFGSPDKKGKEALSISVGDLTSKPKTGPGAPKHGREDPDNTPHVGGNTWAGGTGGSDTAGLGGRGGPYRLDKGHPVHQISEADKAQVSAAARARAREMAEHALAERLRAIDMTPQEMKIYDRYLGRVALQVQQLRVVLGGAAARSTERAWRRRQPAGELDDARLVDGAAGERLIYKRRGVDDNPFGFTAPKKKQIKFVMDVSGSMYRFNGQDSRLERLLEVTTMIMESFQGHESKYSYSVVGHSGDTPEISFIEDGKAPENPRERLKVLQKMVAHSQYCMSGDHTVEATDKAIKSMNCHGKSKEGQSFENYVFVLSDANFKRYGIDPHYLGELLVQDPGVEAHLVLLASLADEGPRAAHALPAGRGHLCLDAVDLPALFKRVFSASFLRSA